MKYIIQLDDKDTGDKRDVWIEDGVVRYTSLQVERTGIFQMEIERYELVPGMVTVDTMMSDAFKKNQGTSYVKRLLLYGFTSFINIIETDYHHGFSEVINSERNVLKDCPIDYIQAVRIPIVRLSDKWIRKLKQESVPIVFITVESPKEIEEIAWQRIVEAMFPKRMLIVCEPSVRNDSERRQIMDVWRKKIEEFKMNTYFQFPPSGQPISTLLAQRIGLFPKKGSLVNGSDADYVMYDKIPNEKAPVRFPEIIVLKGRVVKAGNHWELSGVVGQELTTLMPEKFLPIKAVKQFHD